MKIKEGVIGQPKYLRGDPRKTNSHSPLEILRDLYTAKKVKGQLDSALQQGYP
jgi:hypothetical protein